MPQPIADLMQQLSLLPVYRQFQRVVGECEVWMRAHYANGVDIELHDRGDFVAAVICPVPGDVNAKDFYNQAFYEQWRPETEFDRVAHFNAEGYYTGPPLGAAAQVTFFEKIQPLIDMVLRLNESNERLLQQRLLEDPRRVDDVDWVIDFRATFASKVQNWRFGWEYGQQPVYDPNEPPMRDILHGDPQVTYELVAREQYAGHEVMRRLLDRHWEQRRQEDAAGHTSSAYDTPLLEMTLQQQLWMERYDRERAVMSTVAVF